MRHRLFRALLPALTLFALVSCDGDPSGPDPVSEDQLVFLRAAPGSPPLAALEKSFWVKVRDGGE
ncbi:MAG TPA: hypothetical protein VFQ39_18985, partial [Longimicrobium sp.]|nr:hypothetical protein [Longimicrobium sp.]